MGLGRTPLCLLLGHVAQQPSRKAPEETDECQRNAAHDTNHTQVPRVVFVSEAQILKKTPSPPTATAETHPTKNNQRVIAASSP